MNRILIFGNSGSGKSTMARQVAREHHLTHLDLDQLAWSDAGVRKPFRESATEIQSFLEQNPEWVIEGCYADLLDLARMHATELRFLNPGTETCIANCRSRPWEPEKYASQEEQDAGLDFLLSWVREYETRTDEYSLTGHRELFERFRGTKREYLKSDC